MAKDPAEEESNLRIVLMRLDRKTGTITLLRSDGKEAQIPMTAFPFQPGSRIARMTYGIDANHLLLETVDDEVISAELPTIQDPAPRRGRPVIYLDQNHWSSLAKTLYEPTKVPKAERAAAGKLIGWARARKIILPMSSAHMSETCQWTVAEARYRLALTILQLSGGWQMRDTLDVRGFELHQSLRAHFKGQILATPDVFTLEPYAIHGLVRGGRRPEIHTEFPPDTALAVQALTSISGNFDVMLDADSVAMNDTPAWVEKNQVFGDWLASESSRTQLQKRQSVDVFFLADINKELAREALRSGVTTAQLTEWVMEERDQSLNKMPSLGLFREALQGMHLNRTRWEGNHLTDLMYLTSAAAYADFVVAEKQVASYLEQAQKRLQRPVNVHRRIQDLVPVLEETLSGVDG